MIDLHCHLLPDVDDGPPDIETSLRMAERALHEEIDTIVATPHVSLEYGTDARTIEERVSELRLALDREALPLSVLSGAEISLTRLAALDDAQLERLCLGSSTYVLVESPYAKVGGLLETSLFDLQARGFRPLLAHPERCPEFQREPARLGRLVESGVACSMSAGSVAGQFGQTVRRFAARLLEGNLVHNVSSDAHDSQHRAPALRIAFSAEGGGAGAAQLARWLTTTVPEAILADEPLPPRPHVAGPSLWRRLDPRH